MSKITNDDLTQSGTGTGYCNVKGSDQLEHTGLQW